MTENKAFYEQMDYLALEKPNDDNNPVYSTATNGVCIICHNIPSLPVTWNVLKDYTTIESDKHLKVTKIDSHHYSVKCPSSVLNMICLTCARDYIHSFDKKSSHIRCPFRCCNGINFGKDYHIFMYGDSSRKRDEGAEEAIWSLLFQFGVLNMKCYKCSHVSNDLNELIMHPRIRCTKRKAPCFKCSELVQFDGIDAHRAKCGKDCVISFMH